ncbi:DgyrCDS12261 [Dimorphilus gyrociliatus]|uniref:DgyrCDS12261 n=1 Tax=Dimorphilus gyrociliatus TaxID=2664684 RepID=A0A7I8W5Z0_9ANNE|nr:DgyrCDS12261 [Dimorphilus gyrociliatus]
MDRKSYFKFIAFNMCIFLIAFLLAFYLTPSVYHRTTLQSIKDLDDTFLKNTLNAVDRDRLRNFLRSYASKPHMAGTQKDKVNAEKLYKFWKELGYEAKIIPYRVLLSFPSGNREETNLVRFKKRNNSWWTSRALEKQLDGISNQSDHIVRPFNAFSGSGNVTGTLVYVNYGREMDFLYLRNKFKVDFRGKIAVAKYGKIFRGDKAKTAERWNASGLILFTAPKDYAPKFAGKVYPDGILMPSDGVQRGSLKLEGDLLTPGWSATDESFNYRLNIDEAQLVKIPVLPISYGDAEILLQGFEKEAVQKYNLTSDWEHGLEFENIDASAYYRYEKSNDYTKQVTLIVNVTKEIRTTYNVHAILEGSIETDRYVIVGNHRDAWIYGAIDPSSGTAALLEISAILAKAKKDGWSPKRTIIFCSWAAEEQGLIGSTEWVEQFSNIISARAVAYLNTDIAVLGTSTLRGGTSSGLISNVLLEAAKRVENPNKTAIGYGLKTVYDSWKKYMPDRDNAKRPYISPLGSGSDYQPFINYLGITSVDIFYMYDPSLPIPFYPLYHTAYETVDLVERLYDPEYYYHEAVVRVWMTMVLNLSESTILPFDPFEFANQLSRNVENVYTAAKNLSRDKLEMNSEVVNATSNINMDIA